MRLYLNIDSGSLAGRRFELTQGFLTIGRGERCNIRFDPLTERIASKEHCYIELSEGFFHVVDNGSTNGTLVNGLRVASQKLNHGDRIQFGRNGVTAFIEIEAFPQPSAFDLPSAETQFSAPFPQQANVATDLYIPAPVEPIAPISNQYVGASAPAGDFYYPQPAPFDNRTANLKNSLQSIGMGSQPPKIGVAEEESRNYFVIAGVLFGIVFLSLIVMILIVTSLSSNPDSGIQITAEGIATAVAASVVAFLPAMFYLLPLIWIDRYDPEPAWLLALAFAWGALVAVIVSIIVNTVLASLFGPAFGAVVSAPIFEEGSKGIGLLVLLIFFRKYLDDMLDGIVFAGVIALGFATVENVLYYGRGLADAGVGGLIALFIVRGIASPFAHVTFTAMIGIGVGIARESHNLAVKILLPMLGYFCAVILHMIWNGMAVFGGLGGFALGYAILEFPFFCIFIGFSAYVMFRQNRIIRDMLAIDVAQGIVPAEHLAKATSAFRSTGWLIDGLFSGKFKARSRYLRAIGKLGLSAWHIQRATAAQGQTASFQQNPVLRAEVLKWKSQVD